jgi:glycosyltransferase involved in cell wall biosynthesis
MADPKVLLVGQSLSGGGAQTRMWYLARHLFSGSSDIVTFLPSTAARTNSLRNSTTCLNWHNELSYPRICWQLRRILDKGAYDIVCGFGMLANLPVWVAAFGLQRRPRLIMCEINCPGRVLRGSWERPQTRLTAALLKRAYPAADCVAANSIDGMNECVDLFGVQRARAIRVPNIIDPGFVQSLSRRPEVVQLPSRPFVAMAARLVKEKRIDLAIRALARISESQRPALLIMGDGPERGALERLTDELSVRGDVVFAGWLDNPLPVIARSSVFLLTSSFEGFSNAILEAMTLGVPVVVSSHSSDIEQMGLAGAASTFAPGDIGGLAERIREVTVSAPLRTRLIANARDYCRGHESDRAIPSYEKLFRHVIAGETFVEHHQSRI